MPFNPDHDPWVIDHEETLWEAVKGYLKNLGKAALIVAAVILVLLILDWLGIPLPE